MISQCTLLLTLALTATFGWTQATLPLCAETCAISSAVEAGCNIDNSTCLCTNAAYISDVQSCAAVDCTTAEQQEAVQYFDQNCAVVFSSLGITSTSGTASLSSSVSVPAVSNEATTAKTTAATTKVAAPATSSKSISGFNGSLGGFVTKSDVLKIIAAVTVGLTAMTQF